MKISYAIPVCNEHVELKKLLDFLHKNIDEKDEIVVQCDKGNTTPEVYEVLGTWQGGPLKVIEFPLNGHFSNFKNNLKEHCTGDWIFQIDADELPHESLIVNLKSLLELNPTTEMFLVPRVNTVEGWVNWPDYQTRIIQNGPKIKWQNKVHEQIIGISTKGALPTEEEWCLYHPKSIGRQEAQNNFYDSL